MYRPDLSLSAGLKVVCHWRNTEAASCEFRLQDRFASRSKTFSSSGELQQVVVSVNSGTLVVRSLQYTLQYVRKETRRKYQEQKKRQPHLFQFLFPQFQTPFASLLIHPCNSEKAVRISVWSPPSLFLCSVQRTGGLRKVIASLCPCTFSAVWTPGLWTGLGPASFENGSGAWCQTSWQTCSCRSDAGQNGPGQPNEMLGSSVDGRFWKVRETQTVAEGKRSTK